MLTQKKFIEFCSWKKERLRRFVSYVTYKMGHVDAIKYLVSMRRDIQKETSVYAKTHKFDLMQEQAIRNSETMMRWCEGYYKGWAKKEVIKTSPEYFLNPKKVKSLVNDMWEQYLKRNSY